MAPSAIPEALQLFTYETDSLEFLLLKGDSENGQRIIIMRLDDQVDAFVPDQLRHHRREALSRMANFAERAPRRPLVLPRDWHQYKSDTYVSFFATPIRQRDAIRWIAEVVPGPRSDVVYWRVTTSESKTTLADYEASLADVIGDLEARWLDAIAAAGERFAKTQRVGMSDVEMLLPDLEHSPTKGWSYDQWIEAISDDQRAFLNADTHSSIRLRGPAGSGKTLSLTLKAVREALAARDSQASIRILIATHSWALAAEISDIVESMGFGRIREIDVYPLLEIARALSPQYMNSLSGVSVIGEDSYSGKRAQLDQIVEVLKDFVIGDWLTYRSGTSDDLRRRIDSANDEERLALAWDLLIEFGSVIGAAAIFPGAGAEAKYFQLSRSPWMLPLSSRHDMRVVFHLYTEYMRNLEERSLITTDQVLADFLNYLETHAWNRARKVEGYDLIFVDEFHLFSPIERQVLHYLSRNVQSYPRIFMAIDPRQSPSETFIGSAADDTLSTTNPSGDSSLGDVVNYELTGVHRFTRQILELVKHIHHSFPTLLLDDEWDIDYSAVESLRGDGPLPELVLAESRSGEETDIAVAVQDLYSKGRIALAVVDFRQWPRFSKLAGRIGHSGKFHVSTLAGRSEVEGLGYRRRGLVVAPAEYLAGLQFESVLVAGIPDLHQPVALVNERNRHLALLYLALSRAEHEVRVYLNEDDGGVTDLFVRALTARLMREVRGSRV